MRLYPISKKVGVIDNNAKANLQELIQKMESKQKHVISPNGCGFTTTYTTGGILKNNKNGVFGGNVCGVNENTSHIVFNDKRYIIDNRTGEVMPEETTLKNVVMISSKKLISGISDVINKVKEHFDNSEIVEQYSCSICGLTKKGVERFNEVQKKVLAEMKKDNKQEL